MFLDLAYIIYINFINLENSVSFLKTVTEIGLSLGKVKEFFISGPLVI